MAVGGNAMSAPMVLPDARTAVFVAAYTDSPSDTSRPGVQFPNLRSLGKTISLDSLLAMASRGNLSLEARRKQAESWEALASRTFELPKTQLGVEYGNINSFNADTRIFIGQGFWAPVVYNRLRDYYRAGRSANAGLLAWRERELAREVRLQYYQLQSLLERDSLLQQLDSVYGRMSSAAALRLQSGETNALEKSSADAYLQQLRLQRSQLRHDFRAVQHRLGNLLNSDIPWLPESDRTAYRIPVVADTGQLAAHPLMTFYDGQQQLIRSQTAVERSRMSPEFGVGYSNLSIVGWQSPDGISQKYYGSGDRFHIGQVTMGIPLFNAATKSRIRAGEASARASVAERDAEYRRLQSDWLQWQEVYARQLAAVEYGRSTGIALSDQIMLHAARSLRAGEISYPDWTQMMNQAIQLRIQYLDALAELRRAITELNYLQGNE
jgi:cobalt-zinc-cadmium resistance protein CzcA